MKNNKKLSKKSIIRVLRNSFVKFLNVFHKQETLEESKKKWKKLGAGNANYFVLTTFGEGITEEQFSKSGVSDFEKLIKNDEVLKEGGSFEKKRILEIGCGTGRITEFMSNHFDEVYGVDISEEMIEKAKERLKHKKNITLTPTDGVHLPFSDDFFDITFSFIVFQHMPDKTTVQKNIEEVFRVLKPGGVAKIQLRGEPVKKGSWFYGPSFTISEVKEMFQSLPVEFLKTEGEGMRYFWIWFKK